MSTGDGTLLSAQKLIRAHTYTSFAGLLLSATFGLLVSIKFHVPTFLDGHGWDTWGRLRYDHTQGILYAWLGNAFIAFLYYAVPVLTRRSFTSVRLGWLLFWIWNAVAVLGGWSLVLAGSSQPLEWAEFPLGIAAVIEVALLLLVVQFALPFWKCGASELYVAGWYLLGGITFTALAYPVGNLVPNLLPGAMGAAFSGLWIHDAVGIFITPFATAIAYFVIPAVTKKPIFSHFYSMIGFWLLFLVYPLNGLHHYIYSSLPMTAQHASEVASIYQGIDVIIVVTNLLLSVAIASDGSVVRDIPLRFIWTSVVIYLVVSVEGSIQAIMSFNRFIHFTDWVIGHSHLAMIGFASFAAMGALAHIWQRLPNVRSSRRLLAWSYWLLTIGLAGMVLDLTGAGLVQASLWQQHLPWIDSVRASRPYWIVRTLDGCLLLTGFLTFGASFFVGKRHNAVEAAATSRGSSTHAPHNPRTDHWIATAYTATFGAGLLFFVVSFAALGVLPAYELHKSIVRTTPKGLRLALTPEEKRGQQIYARNGCAYCHTQQVRFTPADEWRFGPPTQAWETQDEFPQMWGTRRIGPDLAHESSKRTRDWQLVHLYNPRFTVPDSMMPGYRWLFDGSPDQPTQDARDLVAYLNTLGRAALQTSAGPPQEPAQIDMHNEMWASAGTSNIYSGKAVYLANCSGCHGADGRGHTPGGRALRPVAFDLADFRLPPERVWRALANGVPGTSMPAWNRLPQSQFRAVANYVLSLPQTPPLQPADQWAPEQTLLLAGKRVFDTHCTRCHGDTGAGDGPQASLFRRPPANFHQVEVSFQGTTYVMQHGVPGSGMPAWPLLTPPEIQAVTVYMRSMYQRPALPNAIQEAPSAHRTEDAK
ncbi:MAG TPA: cbb3-type cytochrome c oxidase subunit I [Terracidiphilus sp.]|nr:cbb3-type cytochrome c oxidase subunit I [Terracidiphilus sp.]HUX43721.1 cbb3-type cytochrome c oxidase subunit I [Terracidiphilus sp.]